MPAIQSVKSHRLVAERNTPEAVDEGAGASRPLPDRALRGNPEQELVDQLLLRALRVLLRPVHETPPVERRRRRLSALDIVPLMMYLAGQPVPSDMEGQLQRALIDPDHLERDPPPTIKAAKAPRLPDEKGLARIAGAVLAAFVELQLGR